jgi:hypothetical protein
MGVEFSDLKKELDAIGWKSSAIERLEYANRMCSPHPWG